MTARLFAEILDCALNSCGYSCSLAARALVREGCKVDRATLFRWATNQSKPSLAKRREILCLPRALGMSPEETRHFLADSAAALGFSLIDSAAPAPDATPFPQRHHFGADYLPPFAGRAAELAALLALVRQGQSVAIIGMAGVGKTRLAQELLHVAADDFAHGCEYLRLSPSQTGSRVIRHVARLLGVDLSEMATAADGQALYQLRERLHGVRLLFLLDNVDRADQVRDLIEAMEGITWVLTARSIGLKRVGVVTLELKPPPPPEAAAILLAHCRYAAVADRGDEAVARAVVERVGRLPVAIALAAGQLASGQLSTLADLDASLAAGGLRSRGQTARRLHLIFEQTIDALPSAARQAFELCGAFPTPNIPLDSYRAVGHGAGLACAHETLEMLADYSLLDLSSPEVIGLHLLAHDYARLRLETSPSRAAVHESFLAHYVFLAESISRDAEQFERDYRRLLPEEDNLMAAAEALHAAADWLRLKRLWPTLSGYLWTVGNYRDYTRVDRLCLDAARATADDEWTAVLLSEVGYVEKETGNWAEAEAMFREAQSFHDASPGNAIPRARLRRYRAEVALGSGDAAQALALLNQADVLLTQSAETPGETHTLARMLLYSAQMSVHIHQGDWPAAENAGRNAEALYRLLPLSTDGQRFGEFRVELGDVLLRLGRPEEAAIVWKDLLSEREGLPYLTVHRAVERRLAELGIH